MPAPATRGAIASAERADARALRRAGDREPRDVRRRRILLRSDAMPWRCDGDGAAQARRRARWRGISRSTPTIRWSGSSGARALLRRLGAALAERPDLFGTSARAPGHLVDSCPGASAASACAPPTILAMLLDGLSSIWPSGHGAARHPDRRRRPPSGDPHRRRDRQHRAVPQAVAVAGLFAARADRDARAST